VQIGTGKFWDTTHIAATAILPVALGALTALLAVARLPLARANHEDSSEARADQGVTEADG
jgi:hypothetical protein